MTGPGLSATFMRMSKLSLIAKLTAAEGKSDELVAALQNMIESAEEESGLEIYSVHADSANDGVFYFFELYADQAAFDVHGKGERMKAAMGALGGGLLGARPEITMMTPVAAKGISL